MGFGGLSGMLAAFITNPIGVALLSLKSAQGSITGKKVYPWGLFPSLLAAVVFVGLYGRLFARMYTFPYFTPHLQDPLAAEPQSLFGGLASTLFALMFKWLRKLIQIFNQYLVLLGVIGGLGMGITAALLPLTSFSGEDQTLRLVQHATEFGFGMLILLAVGKSLATALQLATRWKGGYVSPILFAGVTLGKACKCLFPGVSAAVNAGFACALVADLRVRLFAALFTLAMVQMQTALVVLVVVLFSALLVAPLALREASSYSKERTMKPICI